MRLVVIFNAVGKLAQLPDSTRREWRGDFLGAELRARRAVRHAQVELQSTGKRSM